MKNFIFLNTGWMRDYKGLRNDTISGGGKHVDTTGWGGEIFNFQNSNGKLFGYVEPWGSIQINNITEKVEDDFIKGVTVVWTATRPTGGRYIIGWYKNATVFRDKQYASKTSKRLYKGHIMDYYVTAETKNCKLLSIDERVVKVPTGRKGFGQRNVWYCKDNPHFLKIATDFIVKGIIPPTTKRKKNGGNGGGRQLDLLKRIEIETKAVIHVSKYYGKQGYSVTSFEKDNVGWDLEATHNDIELKLEVKGLSGNIVNVELTPNEYSKMNKHKDSYRLCVVTNTLTKAKLRIYSYSTDIDEWVDEDNNLLQFDEIISARAKAI